MTLRKPRKRPGRGRLTSRVGENPSGALVGSAPVYIQFEDHCTGSGKWTKKDDVFHSICTVEIVGYVAREGKSYVTLSQFRDIGDDVHANLMTVVKSTIIERRNLSVPKRK